MTLFISTSLTDQIHSQLAFFCRQRGLFQEHSDANPLSLWEGDCNIFWMSSLALRLYLNLRLVVPAVVCHHIREALRLRLLLVVPRVQLLALPAPGPLFRPGRGQPPLPSPAVWLEAQLYPLLLENVQVVIGGNWNKEETTGAFTRGVLSHFFGGYLTHRWHTLAENWIFVVNKFQT